MISIFPRKVGRRIYVSTGRCQLFLLKFNSIKSKSTEPIYVVIIKSSRTLFSNERCQNVLFLYATIHPVKSVEQWDRFCYRQQELNSNR